MKKLAKVLFISLILMFVWTSSTLAVTTPENETIAVYGEALSEAQKEETKKLLGVDEDSDIIEITVTAEDIVKYINGNPNSNMYSSAKITRLDPGEGIEVIQVTPENITQVTDEMYTNALLTAGIEDARVEVASPIPVTGHSALTGIFKAYEESGGELDTVRLEVADEELGLSTKLAEEAGLTPDQVSQLITAIKQEIAEQNPVTREEVEQIVQEQLSKLNIELSDEYKQMLYDLFDKIRALDIDFDKVKSQLESLANDVAKHLEEAGIDEGFLQQIGNWFKDLFQRIVDWFKGLFN